MARALITGGTGFIGANLARRLLRDGHEVALLSRPEHNAWRIADIAGDLEIRTVDSSDGEAIVAAVGALRPQWVFHLAAYGAYPTQFAWRDAVATNVNYTMHVLEAALDAGVEAFVNAGSSSEYGLKEHAPSEDEPVEPNSEYAVTKVCGTMFCRQRARARNAYIPTVRLYSVYGPFEEPSRLVPQLILHARRGSLPPLADPNAARDFVHVDDVCEAFVRVASAPRPPSDPGIIYNVGTGTQTTLRDIVDLARRIFDVRSEPAWGGMTSRRWDTPVWVANPQRIARALGWKATITLEDGLRDMSAWLDANPALAAPYLATFSPQPAARSR